MSRGHVPKNVLTAKKRAVFWVFWQENGGFAQEEKHFILCFFGFRDFLPGKAVDSE